MTEGRPGVTLLQGDCREVLRGLGSVDAVITDPIWPDNGVFNVDDPSRLLRDALEVIDAKRIVIVLAFHSDPRFLAAVPHKWPFLRVQTMSYACTGYRGRMLGGTEVAYCFGEPVPSAPGRRVIPGRGPCVSQRTPENGHPCPRHVKHFEWLVNWWSDPGEIVLDPFMGSGTTGVACVNMERAFVGCEIDPLYYQIAERRIAEAQTQPCLEGIGG